MGRSAQDSPERDAVQRVWGGRRFVGYKRVFQASSLVFFLMVIDL